MKKLLSLSIIFVLAGCQSLSTNSLSMPKEQVSAINSQKMPAMAMNISSDQQFLNLMIPHHQEAIDTSKIILQKTSNLQLKAFAEKVIIAQSKEVEQMKVWYKFWYAQDYQPNGKYMNMMADFKNLTEKQADQVYIQGMIAHHQGAINMANQLKTFSKQPDLLNLADNIIASQTSEVSLLKSWL